MAEKKSATTKRAETIKFQNEMKAMFDQLRQPKSKKQSLEEAQRIIYDAWESSPARALKLARQALELSPDCTDAYLILADMETRTTRDRIELLRKGIDAGRRSLGKKFFQENEGHFWGILDTRPFMRAMGALADILWEIGQSDEATTIWHEMLRLNPNDNQGVRYALMSCLMELQRNEQAEGLLECYPGDASAEWAYAAVLLAFRKNGDTMATRRKLAAALKQNPHIPDYLHGFRKIPKRLPEYITIGDETEAISFAAANLAAWAKTSGALEWLRGQQR
jgi:tetratricopeptide (TPR) repeat protein